MTIACNLAVYQMCVLRNAFEVLPAFAKHTHACISTVCWIAHCALAGARLVELF